MFPPPDNPKLIWAKAKEAVPISNRRIMDNPIISFFDIKIFPPNSIFY